MSRIFVGIGVLFRSLSRIFATPEMVILYIVAALLGLIWGGVLLRRTGLFGGCIALMLVACCFGYEFYHVKAGPLPLTLDRVLLGCLLAVYFVFRRARKTCSPPLDKFDLVFGFFLLALTINTFTHDWRIGGAQPLANLIFLYIAPAAIYWIVRESQFDPRHIRWLHAFLGVFSLYLAITAVAEVKQVTSLVWPRYILTSSFQEWLGRARGPFLNPATNGMYLAAGLFAWSSFWPLAGRIGKAALIAAGAVVLLGIYCTLTRSCWLGAAAGLALIIFVNVPKYWRMPLAVFGCLAAGVVLLAKADDLQSFKRDKDVSEYHMAQSAQLRPMLALLAWKITWDYPLFGCGFGHYKEVNIDYIHDIDSEMPLENAKTFVQHNAFLSLLTETGLIGTGIYLVLLGGWVHRAWRLSRDPSLPLAARQHGLLFCAFLIDWFINAMFHDTNLMINSNLLVFLLAGASQGLYAQRSLQSWRAAAGNEMPAQHSMIWQLGNLQRQPG